MKALWIIFSITRWLYAMLLLTRLGQGQKCTLLDDTYDGVCYWFVDVPMEWAEAQEICVQDGGDLVQVKDEDLLRVLSEELQDRQWSSSWLGVYEKNHVDWTWTDGTTKLAYDKWKDPEPRNVTDEECVMLSVNDDFQWDNVDCSYELLYICQKRTSLIECGTDTAEQLKVYWDQICYTIYIDASSILRWTEAKDYCDRLGGSLAKITEAEVQEKLHDKLTDALTTIKQTKTNGFWNGLHIAEWLWLDGSDLHYTNWEGPQPGVDGKCAQMRRSPGGDVLYPWYSAACNGMSPLICQRRLGDVTAPPDDCGCGSLLATGPSSRRDLIGIYHVHNCSHDDRPVYVSSDGRRFIYFLELVSAWMFSSEIGAEPGSDEAEAYVPDDSEYPLTVEEVWQFKTTYQNIWIAEPGFRLECMCNVPFCDEVRVMSSDLEAVFPGTFSLQGMRSGRPYYTNIIQNIDLYFHVGNSCNYWAVAPSSGADQYLMHSYDISPAPHLVRTPWQITRAGQWEVDHNVRVVCN